jgi:MoxR-like ATPase
VFANVVIGDEINRASPKTQSALLESMEEQQVTVDGTTYPLPPPFLVVATQNPVEMDGTYPLPEAQRDRFMVRVAMGYPRPEDELRLLDTHVGADPLDSLVPVADAEAVRRAILAVRSVHVSDALRRFVLDLTQATRTHPDLRLGASPRAGLQLVRAGRALAALSARDHVLPDDIRLLAGPVLAHRLLPSARGRTARKDPLTVVHEITAATPVPGARG